MERINRNRQVVRWTFTYFNYDAELDYVRFFGREEHGIRRIVFGFETTERGLDHLQVSASNTELVFHNCVIIVNVLIHYRDIARCEGRTDWGT